MLILFDIDGTLVDTGGAGMGALNGAVLEVFGREGPPLDLAGSTDGGIVRGLFEHFQKPFDAELERQFYQIYLPQLAKNLKESSFAGRLLPGVPDLLKTLEAEGHQLGLMTGNIAKGAELKCQHYGIADYFSFGSYGDDHWDRNRLGPIALARAEAATGMRFSAEEILVIGDTPKDVACAHAFGARCWAVATGAFDERALADCGADRVLRDLVNLRI